MHKHISLCLQPGVLRGFSVLLQEAHCYTPRHVSPFLWVASLSWSSCTHGYVSSPQLCSSGSFLKNLSKKSCSLSCGFWCDSGICFKTKTLQASFICWLQHSWWNDNHAQAWAAEGNFCKLPETRQSYTPETRVMAISSILSRSSVPMALSINPLSILWESGQWSPPASVKKHRSERTLCIQDRQEAFHRHPCH